MGATGTRYEDDVLYLYLTWIHQLNHISNNITNYSLITVLHTKHITTTKAKENTTITHIK